MIQATNYTTHRKIKLITLRISSDSLKTQKHIYLLLYEDTGKGNIYNIYLNLWCNKTRRFICSFKYNNKTKNNININIIFDNLTIGKYLCESCGSNFQHKYLPCGCFLSAFLLRPRITLKKAGCCRTEDNLHSTSMKMPRLRSRPLSRRGRVSSAASAGTKSAEHS